MFSFTTEPKFVEVRSSNGGTLRTTKVNKPGWVYQATFSFSNTNEKGDTVDKVIIEAYFENT